VSPQHGSRSFDPAEDERLVAGCLAGDRGAWETLVARYERLVYSVARGYRLSDDDLGDVFQEVFAALVKGLSRLREPRTLCRWLSSTTERIARATAYRTRRERERTEADAAALDRPDPDGTPPWVALEVLEEQAMVRIAVARLAKRCRTLIFLLYYTDPVPPYAEIARRLGMSVGSIGPTRARCFDRLSGIVRALSDPDAGITTDRGPTSASEGNDRAGSAVRPDGRKRGSGRAPSVQEAG
jgi:RNA polymerase sigma factor (sigma-70 family)